MFYDTKDVDVITKIDIHEIMKFLLKRITYNKRPFLKESNRLDLKETQVENKRFPTRILYKAEQRAE